jgi:hypothetical protein
MTNRVRAGGPLEPSPSCCAAGSYLRASRLFTVAGRTYSRRDAIALAMLRGDWFAFEAELRQGLACFRWARERQNESRPTSLPRAAEEFRYSRNLLTAEEMEAWLDDARLPFEEWARYLERASLRQVWKDRLREILDVQPIGRTETADCLHAEAVCSGRLHAFEVALAACAALYDAADQTEYRNPVPLDRLAIARASAECAALFTSEQDPETAGSWTGRLLHLGALDARFQAAVQRAATDDGIRAEILARPVEWLRVQWTAMALESEDCAREAAACLRHDREGFEDVAARAHARLADDWIFLEDLAGPDRLAVLAARPGDLVGPFSKDGVWQLALLNARCSPSEQQPQVRCRAESVIRAALTADGAAQVQWHQRCPR